MERGSAGRAGGRAAAGDRWHCLLQIENTERASVVSRGNVETLMEIKGLSAWEGKRVAGRLPERVRPRAREGASTEKAAALALWRGS